MLESIRGAANDDKTIYLMRDNCKIHYGEDDVDIKMEELNIVPIKTLPTGLSSIHVKDSLLNGSRNTDLFYWIKC